MRYSSLIKTSFCLGFMMLSVMSLGCAKQQPSPANPPPVDDSRSLHPDVEHRVSYSGETLAGIAAWYTGKASNWMAIRDANPGLRPERINIGQRIVIPGMLVIERRPMPKKAVQDSQKSRAKATASSVPGDAQSGAAKVNEGNGGTESSVKSTGNTPSDISVDDLLPNSKAPESGGEVAPQPTPVTREEPHAAEKPTEVAPQATPVIETKPTPASTPAAGDAEREKLLDELLTQ